MKHFTIGLLLFIGFSTFAQTNTQRRFESDTRTFFVWNADADKYDQKDSEFESTVIDIREINSKSNGYICIALTDDGKTRLYHGSIVQNSVDDKGVSTWVLRSQNARGKVIYDPFEKKITYSYESNGERYAKVFVFNLLTPVQLSSN